MKFQSRVLIFVLTITATNSFNPTCHRGDVLRIRHICRSPVVPTLGVSKAGTTARSHRSSSSLSLNLFGKDDDIEKKDSDDAEKTSSDSEKTLDKGGRIPFFSRRFKRSSTSGEDADDDEKTKETEIEPSTTQSATTETETSGSIQQKEEPAQTEKAPEEYAKSLRDQAERARLEAERMDAELTLSKIEKLESQLAKARSKGNAIDDLQRQMDNLQAKLRGEAPKPVFIEPPKSSSATKSSTSTSSDSDDTGGSGNSFSGGSISGGSVSGDGGDSSSSSSSSRIKSITLGPSMSVPGMGNIEFDYEDTAEVAEAFDNAPSFMKKLLATAYGLELYDEIGQRKDINATELAQRFIMVQQGDFSYSKKPKPTFTQEQIETEAKKIKEKRVDALEVSNTMTKLADGNETKLALYGLEYDYYIANVDGDALVDIVGDDEGWLSDIVGQINQTVVDSVIDNIYPKCVIKEGQQPTMAQVEMFASTVLPNVKFTATARPEAVLGGYIIRGNHNFENGDDLIEEIDRQMARTSLGDKMTILYTEDFSEAAKFIEGEDLQLLEMMLESDYEPDNILYIVGPDISREPKRVALSITTALGLATSWYLALYPFLLNPTLGKRIEEQLALADASMAYDLDWLTELSVPLFLAFLGLQLTHELAHTSVAGVYNMTTTAPTFVPSLVTGITSAVTTFKKPPKNREQMFDWSIAGPLVGLLASLAAVAVGSSLTLSSDPATLPGLPLEILRQSTLGGSIINGILGNGALNVPEGALGSQAVAGMIIPLHPVAVAGYISLFINALNLLPIGTTDGGRIAMTVFGRAEKQGIGFFALAALLIFGLGGSDLFLFYFAFVIAFQTNNEIPARNEVDPVSFPRVILGTASVVLSLLVLVPFQ